MSFKSSISPEQFSPTNAHFTTQSSSYLPLAGAMWEGKGGSAVAGAEERGVNPP